MRLDSIAFRLIAASMVWTLLVLPAAGFIIYSLYRDDVQASFDSRLEKLVTAITIDSMLVGAATPVPPNNLYEPLFEVTHSGWYWQIKPLDDQLGPTLKSASLATASLPSPEQLGYPADPDTNMRWRNDAGPDGKPVRIVEVVDTIGHRPEAPRYSIVVAGPSEWLEYSVATFRSRLTLALALAGAALLGLMFVQIRFGLSPLQKVEQAVADVRSGEAARLEGEVPAEIEPLRDELNALIQSNEDIIERARTQVGNLAHGLKTPIAVIANEAREHDSALGNKVIEQTQLMSDQVQHYLERARMVARVGAVGRITPVGEVAAPLVRALEKIHSDKAIKIAVDCPKEARFQGEKHDLEEMLGNLLDNACKWSNGRVALNVRVVKPDKRTGPVRLKISVEDDGPGLTPEQRARIGKRGLRLDETKPGTGLGLSIVIDLAQSYRGRLSLFESPLGGLKASLDLPAA
ncbi:MAG: sensor histidine kinase [Alphaproteobacteria bacterium]|nr:sensor histidine kinase [Alphaproteobacteria bacterium]